MILPFIKTQLEIVTEIRRRLRDTGSARWTDNEIYNALNDSLDRWYKRVMIPYIYTIEDGWTSTTSEYVLPSYIRGPIDPQQKLYHTTLLALTGISTSNDQWVDILSFNVYPNTDGGQTLQLSTSVAIGEGRIIYWDYNYHIPTSIVTTSGSITSSSTSVTIASVVDVGESGFIKIDSEWMQYSGITIGASTMTLNNLKRGMFNTSAASHNGSSNVYWGIAVHRMDLYTQLYDQLRSELHSLFLTNAAESERSHHERMAMYYQNKADEYWRRYQTPRPPKLRLGRTAIGTIDDNNLYEYYSKIWGT